MAFKPNYNFQKAERNRAKLQKKQEKLKRKQEARDSTAGTDDAVETDAAVAVETDS